MSTICTFLLHVRWKFCHLSSSCKWDKFLFIEWIINVTCQTSKDKGSANNNYDDAGSFQITILVHKTTFFICVGIYIYIYCDLPPEHNALLAACEESVLVSFLITLWDWTYDFGAVGHPLYQCAMQSSLKVWWRSRNYRPSKPKLNSCKVLIKHQTMIFMHYQWHSVMKGKKNGYTCTFSLVFLCNGVVRVTVSLV